MTGVLRFPRYVVAQKCSTGTIQISLKLTEPEALADFLRRGSACASGSKDCIGKFKFYRTGRKCFAWTAFLLTLLVLIGCRDSSRESAANKQADTDLRNLRKDKIDLDRSSSIASTPSIPFLETAKSLGISHTYQNGEQGKLLFQEATGGGHAWIDYDRDGLPDLYFNQGGDVTKPLENQPLDALYRNMGTSFKETTIESGIVEPYYSQGVAVADFDSDGFDDIYVTNFQRNTFWKNQGDGTFQDIAQPSGVACDRWSTSAAWFDIENDGDLDLYVCNYALFDPATAKPCINDKGEAIVCSPAFFEPSPDVCYINQGDGTFTEESQRRGLFGPGNRALGVVAFDSNKDGLMDIYVANDTTPNFMFINQGEGMFAEQAFLLGCAVNKRGVQQASMGLAANDFDGNGFIDLYSTHFYADSNTLYANLGPNGFSDVTGVGGLHEPTLSFLGFGTVMQDFDGNGSMEIFVSNGHIDNSGTNTNQRMRPQMFTYQGRRWAEISDKCGDYFHQKWIGRGVSHGDWDGDGDLDLVISHQNQPAAMLRNDSPAKFVVVELVGTLSNRNAIGAKVTLTTSTGRYYRELMGGVSYCTSSQRRLSFGVNPDEQTVSIEIEWPSGMRQHKTEQIGKKTFHFLEKSAKF